MEVRALGTTGFLFDPDREWERSRNTRCAARAARMDSGAENDRIRMQRLGGRCGRDRQSRSGERWQSDHAESDHSDRGLLELFSKPRGECRGGYALRFRCEVNAIL